MSHIETKRSRNGHAGAKSRLHPTHNDLPQTARRDVIELLNARLADGSDLYSQVKQAHWNVKGANFIALHKLFDKVAEEVEDAVDQIAERAVQLGGTAMGTARLAAANSSLEEYPHEITDSADHVEALSKALATFGAGVRAGIETADGLGDKDTADLFTQVSRMVDKNLWFVESHGLGR